MAVEITVNWNFLGDGENAQVAYGTPAGEAGVAEEPENGDTENFPFFGSVLPLSSSVLAPGLSMPIPAR